MATRKIEVPIWEKMNLTIEEAAALFGIGQNKLRELVKEQNTYTLDIGTKKMIKRKQFEKFLENVAVL